MGGGGGGGGGEGEKEKQMYNGNYKYLTVADLRYLVSILLGNTLISA